MSERNSALAVRGLNILGWVGDLHGSGNYRIGMPMWALSQLGHDAKPLIELTHETLLHRLDVFVGQRIAEPAMAGVWKQLAGHDRRSFAMVYELDDDFWNLEPDNPMFSWFAQPENRRLLEESVSVSDAVTASTNHLATVLSQFNDNVFVLPNCVDESVLHMERSRSDRLTIGWAGTPTHKNDFLSVQSELTAFLRRNPNVDTHFVGTNYGPLVGRRDTRATTWHNNLNDYLAALDFDIGIAPLAFTRFNRSKSDIKFLEYASRGIPIVATNHGPYAESVQHGVTGFLAKFPHEWAKYLRLLVNDEDAREEIGRNAKAWAATRTIQANAPRWEQVYRQAVADRAAPTQKSA